MQPVFSSPNLKIYRFTVNPFQENTYVLAADGQAIIVDPGFFFPEEKSQFDNWLKQENLTVVGCWLTHSHIDHVMALAWLTDRFKVGYIQYALDAEQLRAVPLYAPAYGIHDFHLPTAQATFVGEGDVLNFRQTQARILFLPGHAPGHIGFYLKEEDVLLAGDVLFRESIGRTDLPGGSFEILERSIRQKLYVLPNETMVLPGHMESTTIGHEKDHNPFVRK